MGILWQARTRFAQGFSTNGTNQWGTKYSGSGGSSTAFRFVQQRQLRQRSSMAAVLTTELDKTKLGTAKYKAELERACAAVRLASKLCQNIQNRLEDQDQETKSDDSPVTVADYGAQAIVTAVLSRFKADHFSLVAEEDSSALKSADGAAMLSRITLEVNEVLAEQPDISLLSTEDVESLIGMGGSEGGSAGSHWVLDPIDGTRGFVSKRQYAVCLGLVVAGKVVLGVLGCPNLPLGSVKEMDNDINLPQEASEQKGCLFVAHEGCGAYVTKLWDKETPLQPISVSQSSDFSTARFMESFEARHSDHSFTAQIAKRVGVTLPPLRLDSQAKYGLLSRGDASIYLRFPAPTYREKIWDHCAGNCIIKEAGGKVTDASGAELDFSKGRWLDLNRGIIAAPAQLHESLLKAVQELK